jgi:hypothetical protein
LSQWITTSKNACDATNATTKSTNATKCSNCSIKGASVIQTKIIHRAAKVIDASVHSISEIVSVVSVQATTAEPKIVLLTTEQAHEVFEQQNSSVCLRSGKVVLEKSHSIFWSVYVDSWRDGIIIISLIATESAKIVFVLFEFTSDVDLVF